MVPPYATGEHAQDALRRTGSHFPGELKGQDQIGTGKRVCQLASTISQLLRTLRHQQCRGGQQSMSIGRLAGANTP